MDDLQEQAFQAEVHEVFQRYRRQYPGNQFRQQRPTEQRFQGNRFHQKKSKRFARNCLGNPQQFMPRHQSTTVANQAYTFNSTTAQSNVSYAPGTINMGPMHQAWGYQSQGSQYQPYHNQFGANMQPQCLTALHRATTHNQPTRPRPKTPMP